MFKILPLLLLLSSPLFVFSQQSEKPMHIESRKAPSPFGPLQFRNDSITIKGVYKNYRHAPGDLFKVTFMDWISSKAVHHTAPIDPSGRFTLTIPLLAETDMAIDDNRFREKTIAIPGETIYLEADLKDSSFHYSGANARLHNELYQFFQEYNKRNAPLYTFSEWFKQFGSVPALRDTMRNVLRDNLLYLSAWQQQHKPEPRTVQYLQANMIYETAMPLTQYLYHIEKASFSPIEETAHFHYLDSIIALNGNSGYLSENFLIVHRDFRNYSGDKARVLKLNKDSLYQTRIRHPREKEVTEIWYFARHLKEGSILRDEQLATLRANVQDTVLLNNLIRRNDALKALLSDDQMLKSTRFYAQFPDLKTPEEIFAHITAPYRGKVIYLDLWGTWCSPCLEMMQYMPGIKKQYTDKDVVFLYLAIKSPEAVWQKTIREYKMTGPAVVHYRLPDDLQDAFENKYRTASYPSYFLIDKTGKLISSNAPWPRDAAALHAAINKLL